MRFWRKILLALLAFLEVLVLGEVVAVGASGRFSSHSFNKCCCLCWKKRQLRFGSYTLWFRGQAVCLSFRLNTSQRHPGVSLMGKVFATQVEQFTVRGNFQLSALGDAGDTFSVQLLVLIWSCSLTSSKSTMSKFGSLQSCSLAVSMVENFPIGSRK